MKDSIALLKQTCYTNLNQYKSLLDDIIEDLKENPESEFLKRCRAKYEGKIEENENFLKILELI